MSPSHVIYSSGGVDKIKCRKASRILTLDLLSQV